MALTDTQRTDIRRWMGHPVLNAGEPDTVYAQKSSTAFTPVSLTMRLDNLSASEETALAAFLTTLAALEAAIPAAGENLDTEVAGPWTARKDEVAQRASLYDRWRRDLCFFLGFKPGPGLGGGSGGLTFVRA